MIGDNNANIINAYTGSDTITGNGGNDTIDGGEGLRIVVYGLSASNYTVTAITGGYQVVAKSGLEGTDSKLNSAHTSTQSLSPKNWSTSYDISDTTTADNSVKLVGVFTGDMDGSWIGA